MNILLVNPNRFPDPPVIPIGLEYIAAAIELTGKHKVKVLDLCFSDEPESVLKNELSRSSYDLAGFTVRNIDSVVIKENSFFLDDIAALISIAKKAGLRIVAGGAACDADPASILDYLNADHIIYGPGEKAFCVLLEDISAGRDLSPVINGRDHGIITGLSRNPMKYFDYTAYFEKGGIAGFQTKTGCAWRCHFCFESAPVCYRNHEVVVEDIIKIIRAGYGDFHLGDPEFNQSLSESEAFLKVLYRRLKGENLEMNWSPYLKPEPVSREMLDLFSLTGVNLITLSVESSEKSRRLHGYSDDHLAFIIKNAEERGIKTAVDMLSGAPGETIDELKKAVGFFKSTRPKRVGINTAYRVYRNTPLYRYLLDNFESEKEYITNRESFFENPLLPVFYQKLTDSDVNSITEGDKLFKIEGDEMGVNYQRT